MGGIALIVQVACPEYDVCTKCIVVVCFGCPGISCCGWRDKDVSLFRPCDEIRRFPDFEIATARAN